jgi:peptidoglycan/LPS O-acetylase OafA/YrhL
VVTKRGIQHIPAIDGLRAVAVIAVILYHLGVSWIPGGFLGVDLFFVISGYVITRLLLDSIQRSGGLDLRDFYRARARRLLPPLLFMASLTLLYISIFAQDTVKRFLTDLPFSISGAMNWWLVFREQDYFETIGRPPLLQHTWSLAVEAQFYLIWPLILLVVLKYFGKKRIPGAALGIAAVSGLVLMAVSFELDASSGSAVSHIYFGTDTHSIGLFLGSALAVSWVPQNFEVIVSKKAQDFIDGIGVFGFIGILATFLFIDESDPTLYRIAFPLAGLFGTAIIISIVHPASRFAPLLSNRVLLWIGERSYAIYLWHWVVFQLTRPTVDLEGQSWALFLLRILLVAALADISLRWIELPIRSGAVRYWFKGMKYRTKKVRNKQLGIIGIVILLFVSTSSFLSLNAIRSTNTKELALKESLTSVQVKPLVPDNPAAEQTRLWVTGDSVILGIRQGLGELFPIVLINARVGRQAPELLEEITKDILLVGDAPIVFNLGNNGILKREDVFAIFEVIKNQRLIIVVNTAVPRPWREANNQLLAEVASNYQRVNIVDWANISKDHPEYFAPDGVHLVPTGATAYVQAITQFLR